MKSILPLTVIGLIITLGCANREPIITIVDIGHLDRLGIAKQLRIINKYSPRVIGLDFMLTTDSLDKDKLLGQELARAKNLVQSSILHNYNSTSDSWDSLEVYNSNFVTNKRGFSNITITEDSVFAPELPMRQNVKGKTETSLSYAIAQNSFGVNPIYENHGSRYLPFLKAKIGKYFKIISASDLLNETFDRDDLKDKIVILGHSGSGENTFYLDKERTKRISGVEIQASILRQIINFE